MSAKIASDRSKPRTGVLLIHGLCGSPAELRFVANSLSRQGYVVHCPTLAGHGASSSDLASSTWQDWLASARAGLKELEKSCDSIVVGGLSTGAVLALMLAASHPRLVSGLLLYSPTFWLNGREVPWQLKLARRLLAWRPIARRFTLPSPEVYGIKDERMRELVRRSMNQPGMPGIGGGTPAITALERCYLVKEALGVLGAIRQPALIVHPREDCLADLSNAFHLQKNLGGISELLVLDDSYHLVTIDRQRQQVADASVRFVADIGARRAPARSPSRSPAALAVAA